MNSKRQNHIRFLFLFLSFSSLCFAQPAQLKVVAIDSAHRATGGVRIHKSAQNDSHYIIDKVVIEGNRRTKELIIRRELDFKEGDSIPASKADSLLRWERNKIYNLNLFITTDISLKKNDTTGFTTVYIKVREQFYTIPQPILDISDRNYNEWIFVHGADLRRVNIGIRLTQRNVFGLNQTLKFTVQGGFTNSYELNYDIPYLNKRQRLGMTASVKYSNARSVGYATKKDTILFFPKVPTITLENPLIINYYRAGVSFYYRKYFFTRHTLELAYIYNAVSDTIAKLNPNFFLNGRNVQQYAYMKYTFEDDRRDIKQFAHKGRVYRVELEQLGFTKYETQNITKLTVTYAKYFELGKKFLFAFRLKGKTSFPVMQPYIDARALGSGEDFVRGYDRHPIEGQHYFLSRNSFRFKTFSTLIDLKKIIPIKQFRVIPLDFYLSAFADAGYVSNQFGPSASNNRYSNKFLGCVGVGINLVTFYNSVLRLEYSYNAEGEWNPSFFMATDI